MKPYSWCCQTRCNVTLLCFMLLDEVFLGNVKDTHCLVMARANYESTRSSVLSFCVAQRSPFSETRHQLRGRHDMRWFVWSLEGSSIKTKYRKRLAIFSRGCTKVNSVYGSALQCVVMTFSLRALTFHPLTQSPISATKLRPRVVRTFEACRGSIGR